MKRVQRRRRGGLGGGAVAGCMNGGGMMTGTSADKPPPYTRPSTHRLPSPTPAIPSPSAHYSITPQPHTHPMHPMHTITIAAACPCGGAERNREASAKQYKHVSQPTHIPPATSLVDASKCVAHDQPSSLLRLLSYTVHTYLVTRMQRAKEHALVSAPTAVQCGGGECKRG